MPISSSTIVIFVSMIPTKCNLLLFWPFIVVSWFCHYVTRWICHTLDILQFILGMSVTTKKKSSWNHDTQKGFLNVSAIIQWIVDAVHSEIDTWDRRRIQSSIFAKNKAWKKNKIWRKLEMNPVRTANEAVGWARVWMSAGIVHHCFQLFPSWTGVCQQQRKTIFLCWLVTLNSLFFVFYLAPSLFHSFTFAFFYAVFVGRLSWVSAAAVSGLLFSLLPFLFICSKQVKINKSKIKEKWEQVKNKDCQDKKKNDIK